jgi:hypothetical protein
MHYEHADSITPEGWNLPAVSPAAAHILPKIDAGANMDEQDARDYFERLPLDERLRLVRDILGDIEARISRARAELNGESPQLVLPDLEGLVPPLPAGLSGEAPPVSPTAGQTPAAGASYPAEELPPPGDLDDLAGFDIDGVIGGQSHTINRLRLIDAAAQYEKLLKKYGYVRGVPGPKAILRREAESAQPKGRQRRQPDTAWAEWVARDAETLDRPYPHEWSDWVALGDDEGED